MKKWKTVLIKVVWRKKVQVKEMVMTKAMKEMSFLQQLNQLSKTKKEVWRKEMMSKKTKRMMKSLTLPTMVPMNKMIPKLQLRVMVLKNNSLSQVMIKTMAKIKMRMMERILFLKSKKLIKKI